MFMRRRGLLGGVKERTVGGKNNVSVVSSKRNCRAPRGGASTRGFQMPVWQTKVCPLWKTKGRRVRETISPCINSP